MLQKFHGLQRKVHFQKALAPALAKLKLKVPHWMEACPGKSATHTLQSKALAAFVLLQLMPLRNECRPWHAAWLPPNCVLKYDWSCDSGRGCDPNIDIAVTPFGVLECYQNWRQSFCIKDGGSEWPRQPRPLATWAIVLVVPRVAIAMLRLTIAIYVHEHEHEIIIL